MVKFRIIGCMTILIFAIFMVETAFIKSVEAAKKPSLITEEGFLISYGNGFVGGSHQRYRPFLNIIHIGFNAHKLFPSIIPAANGRLTLYLEPQYNLVTRPSGNYEMGIGMGIEYRLKFIKGVDGYFLVGSGIHYISFDSKDQSGGFNFNDNIGGGLYIFTTKNTAINLGFRFRHISNANLNMPNEGINSYLFMLGYSLFFK